ncbi:MAG: dihydroorotate dehydrogenase electron transfer subunit [Candidatus Thermoplasmatota archaeon]
MNTPTATEILKTKKENKNVKTLTFRHPDKVKPGQFYMIWLPEVDEIPMSVSDISEDTRDITFKKVGDATKQLFDIEPGDKIGVRGPFGNGFEINDNPLVIVGGGTGVAMIYPAAVEALEKGIETTVIAGFKNKDEVFFEEKLNDIEAETYITTDDGSKGLKGFATETAEREIKKQDYNLILTCGPEKMMHRMLQVSKQKNIPMQASLERYMKCSIGICGQCCIGPGLRVCKDGPIFTDKTLDEIEEFGRYKRDAAGRKIKI